MPAAPDWPLLPPEPLLLGASEQAMSVKAAQAAALLVKYEGRWFMVSPTLKGGRTACKADLARTQTP